MASAISSSPASAAAKKLEMDKAELESKRAEAVEKVASVTGAAAAVPESIPDVTTVPTDEINAEAGMKEVS